MLRPDELPYVSASLGGVGGVVKRSCEDFVVTEVMSEFPPAPSTKGNVHYWLLVRRTNLTTFEVVARLAAALDADAAEIGRAGLKDKRAVATQWFSVPRFSRKLERMLEEDDVVERVQSSTPLELLELRRAATKLRLGQHSGNRFDVRLAGATWKPEVVSSIKDTIEAGGFPNYFGPQRFGSGVDLAVRGSRTYSEIREAYVRGDHKKAQHMKRTSRKVPLKCLANDAFSSMLFNVWLARRLSRRFLLLKREEDDLDLKDDDLKDIKDDDIKDAAAAADLREDRGYVFGSKVPSRGGRQLLSALEKEVLEDFCVTSLDAMPGPGDYRKALVKPDDLAITPADDGIRFTFQLPKGAYATMLLREFAKTDDFCFEARRGGRSRRTTGGAPASSSFTEEEEIKEGKKDDDLLPLREEEDDDDDATTTTSAQAGAAGKKKKKPIPRRPPGDLNHGKRGRAFFAAPPAQAAIGRRRERKLREFVRLIEAAEARGSAPDPDVLNHPLMYRRIICAEFFRASSRPTTPPAS